MTTVLLTCLILRSGFAETEHWPQYPGARSDGLGSSIQPCYLISGERLFEFYDSGLMACFHARTGEEIIPKQRLTVR